MKADRTPAPEIADLWRGWRDPVTGTAPPRLGMDYTETVFVLREVPAYVAGRPHAWLAATQPA